MHKDLLDRVQEVDAARAAELSKRSLFPEEEEELAIQNAEEEKRKKKEEKRKKKEEKRKKRKEKKVRSYTQKQAEASDAVKKILLEFNPELTTKKQIRSVRKALQVLSKELYPKNKK